MKVALIMPTYFAPGSIIAGGERYAYELAKALSKKASTTLFTFSSLPPRSHREGDLTIEYCRILFNIGGIANPVSFEHWLRLYEFDVIHCLQFKTVVTESAIILGRLLGKRVFVTDLAGGTIYSLSRLLPVEKLAHQFLYISEFNHRLNVTKKINNDYALIYGGVDIERFYPPVQKIFSQKKLLYVGRIFPPKGIHVLLEALPPGCSLDIVGQCRDMAYLSKLKKMASNLDVNFFDSLADAELISKYHEAAMTVLPSLLDGGFTSAMESMACGTPVIASCIGSMPEILEEGKTGFLVPADNAEELRKKIIEAFEDKGRLEKMSRECRKTVLEKYTWDKVAERCFDAYRGCGLKTPGQC